MPERRPDAPPDLQERRGILRVHTRRSHRVLLSNADDSNPITVRAAFYGRAGGTTGCRDITLRTHDRKFRKVHEIPLTPCP